MGRTIYRALDPTPEERRVAALRARGHSLRAIGKALGNRSGEHARRLALYHERKIGGDFSWAVPLVLQRAMQEKKVTLGQLAAFPVEELLREKGIGMRAIERMRALVARGYDCRPPALQEILGEMEVSL